jgi:hypothetical protein
MSSRLTAIFTLLQPNLATSKFITSGHAGATSIMGVFSDRTSVERILFAVFTYENKQQGIATPFLLTQNS